MPRGNLGGRFAIAKIVRLSALGLVFGFAFMVAAAPHANAMTLVGVFNENDPFPDDLLGSPALAKCDLADGGSCVWENGTVEGENYADGDFTLLFLPDLKSGAWSFAPNDGESLVPTFVVVKAGNYYAVYSLDESETSGVFTSADIPGNPAISHISFYDGAATTPPPDGGGGVPPIPEPATWIMMIFGFWIVAWRLRNRRSYASGMAPAHA